MRSCILDGASSGSSLQFTSCEDVRNKGLMSNAYYLINGQRTYCENWSKLKVFDQI